jgi:hypothetical protein
MAASLHREGRFWPIKLLPDTLLNCMFQARKVSVHVFVCQCIDFASVSRSCICVSVYIHFVSVSRSCICVSVYRLCLCFSFVYLCVSVSTLPLFLVRVIVCQCINFASVSRSCICVSVYIHFVSVSRSCICVSVYRRCLCFYDSVLFFVFHFYYQSLTDYLMNVI